MDDRNDYKSLVDEAIRCDLENISNLEQLINKFCLDHKGYVCSNENGFNNFVRTFAEKVRAL